VARLALDAPNDDGTALGALAAVRLFAQHPDGEKARGGMVTRAKNSVVLAYHFWHLDCCFFLLHRYLYSKAC